MKKVQTFAKNNDWSYAVLNDYEVQIQKHEIIATFTKYSSGDIHMFVEHVEAIPCACSPLMENYRGTSQGACVDELDFYINRILETAKTSLVENPPTMVEPEASEDDLEVTISKYTQVFDAFEYGWGNPHKDEDGITNTISLDNGYVIEIDFMFDGEIRCKTIDFCETYSPDNMDKGKNHKSVKSAKAVINYINRMGDK